MFEVKCCFVNVVLLRTSNRLQNVGRKLFWSLRIYTKDSNSICKVFHFMICLFLIEVYKCIKVLYDVAS